MGRIRDCTMQCGWLAYQSFDKINLQQIIVHLWQLLIYVLRKIYCITRKQTVVSVEVTTYYLDVIKVGTICVQLH